MNEDDVIEAEEIEEVEPVEQAEAIEPEAAEPADPAEDEIVVSIGDEPAEEDQAPAPDWVRELRKKNREDQRVIRELQEQLRRTQQAEVKPLTLGKKPALEDFEYDTEKYETELAGWYERKRQHDDTAAKYEADAAAANAAWQAKLAGYGAAKAALKVKDFEDAEAATQDALTVVQQGIILQGADNPAVIVYALGRNPAKLAELSKITDPVKFSFAVAKLEKDLKVTTKKQAPPPERVIQGTGRVSGTVDSKLDQLREQAAKTGDYSKVAAYKLQKRGG